MSTPIILDAKMIDSWADDLRGPVALALTQVLVPVEGETGVVFPPTYPDIGYNIDALPGGQSVATIDSVASQANRMEPMFAERPGQEGQNPLAALVPQVDVGLPNNTTISLMDAGHRLGDALIRCSDLGEEATAAFTAYAKSGDAELIAKIAPTSLVFGAWDSRGTGAKVPRIVQSVIRGWNVTKIHRSAIYTAPVDYSELGLLSEEDKTKAEKDNKSPAAQKGFVNALAISSPGGVVVHGEIRREVTVNLVALRRLTDSESGSNLRKYILGLALVAAAEPGEAFLRQGCLLTPHPEKQAQWELVSRDGQRTPVALSPEAAFSYAQKAANAYQIGENRTVKFQKERAEADLKGVADKKEKGKNKKGGK